MSHGYPDWWDPVQHYQLDSFEQKASQRHRQLERKVLSLEQEAIQHHKDLGQEAIDHHDELAQRVHKAETNIVVMEARAEADAKAKARAEADGTVSQLEARVQSLANELNQCHDTMRLYANEIQQLRSRLEELEAKVNGSAPVVPASAPAAAPCAPAPV